MSDELKTATAAIEAVNRAFEEFKTTNDEKLAEIEKKSGPDVLLDEKLARIETDLQKAQDIADKAALAQKRSEHIITDAAGSQIDLNEKSQKWADDNGYRETFTHNDMIEYQKAFRSYLKRGDQIMHADQLKALSVGSDPDGGYTVTPDMSGSMASKVFESSPMRAYASVQVIGTDALEGRYDDDEGTVGWVNETAARPGTDTPQMGVWRIPVHELYANPQATQKLLDDSNINIEQWLNNKIADKMGRTEATAFVTGDGVGKPRGFTTYTDGTSIREQVEQIDTGVNGDFAAAPAGGDTLITALYSLKAPYKANASWFMNRTTMAGVRKEKDTDGAYIWQPGIQAGQPATLLGYPVAPAFEDMATYTVTGALAIAVGDMRAAYQIVERQGIRILRDPYTNKPYVGFYSVKRVGGGLLNGEALKLIAFKA